MPSDIIKGEIIDDSKSLHKTTKELANINNFHKFEIKKDKSGNLATTSSIGSTSIETIDYINGAKSITALQVPNDINIKQRNNTIKDLRKKGHKVKQIASATNLSISRIYQITNIS